MKKFIYLFAIVGLLLTNQGAPALAYTCTSAESFYPGDDDLDTENIFCEEKSGQTKPWFINKPTYYRKGIHGQNRYRQGHAETISLSNSRFTVSKITKSLAIQTDSCFWCTEEKPKSIFINKLLISAQGTGFKGTIQVVVNGDIKGTIHVPSADPTYFVTVDEVANSIEFVPVNGTVKVLDIKLIGSQQTPYNYNRNHNSDRAYVDSTRRRGGHGYSEYHNDDSYYNQAQDMALRSIDIVNELMDYSSYRALGIYLLPIKKSAAKVYAIAGSSQYSKKMLKALKQLAKNIAIARPYTSKVLESSALFEIAMELMSFEEELRSMSGGYVH